RSKCLGVFTRAGDKKAHHFPDSKLREFSPGTAANFLSSAFTCSIALRTSGFMRQLRMGECACNGPRVPATRRQNLTAETHGAILNQSQPRKWRAAGSIERRQKSPLAGRSQMRGRVIDFGDKLPDHCVILSG